MATIATRLTRGARTGTCDRCGATDQVLAEITKVEGGDPVSLCEPCMKGFEARDPVVRNFVYSHLR
ncbi:MAG TPA: hypothetical protein VET65_07305 [Candidatus Limnocylindrales bacterium]|nr:hypothetical protein [Candidatus Limnocylindrales bacterium]